MNIDLQDHIDAASLPPSHSFLQGNFSDGDGSTFKTIHPATGDELAVVASATSRLIDAAVRYAAEAQMDWANRKPSERSQVLNAIADALIQQADRLATIVTLDNGKTFREAMLDVLGAVNIFRQSAAWAITLESHVLPVQTGLLRLTWREPIGVVAGIIPFNAAAMFTAMKSAPALAAGNAIIIKAPEQAPLAPPIVASIATAAGLPAGLLQVVQGGAETGEALVASSGIMMVSFTGSTRTGRSIMAAAGRRPIPVIMELGGKSANIVFDDADLDIAVAGSVAAAFSNAGQRCLAGSLLFLQDGIADEFTDRLISQTEQLQVGDPFDSAMQVGPVISAKDADRILNMVSTAVDEGATVLTGGTRPADCSAKGSFVAPTVVGSGSIHNLRLSREEVFGPVLLVSRFTTDAEAVDLANRSTFGLVGGCWTNQLDRAMSAANGVQAGVFWVNGWGNPSDLPFGGRKDSGFGSESGHQGHEVYTNLKSVIINTAGAVNAPRFP